MTDISSYFYAQYHAYCARVLMNVLYNIICPKVNLFQPHVGTTPREREREGGGGSGEYNFVGPSPHPLLEQRDRGEITQMHRLSRAFAVGHVFPAYKSGSAHVDFMLGPASSAR